MTTLTLHLVSKYQIYRLRRLRTRALQLLCIILATTLIIRLILPPSFTTTTTTPLPYHFHETLITNLNNFDEQTPREDPTTHQQLRHLNTHPLSHPTPLKPPQPLTSSYHNPRPQPPLSQTTSPPDFHIPHILTTHVRPHPSSPSTHILFTLFTQGADSLRHNFHLNVRACLVGDTVVAVERRLINVFVCVVEKEKLAYGDVVTLVVDDVVFRRGFVFAEEDGRWEREGIVERYVGRRLVKVVKSEQVWGVNVVVDNNKSDKDMMGVWEVCAMYQDKQSEIEDVVEWIEYHRRIGVDRVFVYDNNDNSDLLQRTLSGRRDTEIVYWPWRKSQEIAQNHFLVLAKSRCRWVLMVDVDEFVMIRQGGTLKDVVRKVEMMDNNVWGGVSLPSLTMGSSGFVTRKRGMATPEMYTHRLWRGDWHRRKPLVLAADVVPRSRVHYLPLRREKRMFQMKSHPERRTGLDNNNEDGNGVGDVFVVHYTKKSWQDYFRKTQIGRAALEVDDWDWGKGTEGYMHEKFRRRRESHVSLGNQREWTEFLDVWRKVMRREVGEGIVVERRRDDEDREWWKEGVWYDKRWWEPFI